jgi:tetratricopeptide (TPR) repeat protein
VILHGGYDHHMWHRDHWEDVCAALIWGLEHQRDEALIFLKMLTNVSKNTGRSRLRIFLNEIIESHCDPWVKANVCYRAALLAKYDEDVEATYRAYERSIALYEQAGDLKQQGLTLIRLGRVAREYGHIAAALDAYKRGLEVGRLSEDLSRQRHTLDALVEIHIEQKEWSSAYDALLQLKTLALNRDDSDLDTRNDLFHDLGLVLGKLGHPAESRHYFVQDYAVWDREGFYRQKWRTLWQWGEQEIEQGAVRDGYHLWQLALVAAYAIYDQDPERLIPGELIAQQRTKLASLEQTLGAEDDSL